MFRKFSVARPSTGTVPLIKELPLLTETPMLKREVREKKYCQLYCLLQGNVWHRHYYYISHLILILLNSFARCCCCDDSLYFN